MQPDLWVMYSVEKVFWTIESGETVSIGGLVPDMFFPQRDPKNPFGLLGEMVGPMILVTVA